MPTENVQILFLQKIDYAKYYSRHHRYESMQLFLSTTQQLQIENILHLNIYTNIFKLNLNESKRKIYRFEIVNDKKSKWLNKIYLI